MHSTEKIKIYPGFDAMFYTFYLLGINRAFPEMTIQFGDVDFPMHLVAYLAMEYRGKKILIDAMDTSYIDDEALAWCDICGKVNLTKDEIKSEYREKVFPIGPNFGVRYYQIFEAMPLAVLNFIKANLKLSYLKKYLGAYFHQYYSRLYETDYVYNEPENDKYIFSTSSYWHQAPITNENRRRFFACAESVVNLTFEGGFYSSQAISEPEFRKYHLKTFLTSKEYIQNIKKSIVVFNTPAVKHCLGWKLGEYLALGKAIISTPIARDLPAELIHGTHIHLVDGSQESICEAIKLLLVEKDYRRKLENNARLYYDQYLKPEKAIFRIFTQLI